MSMKNETAIITGSTSGIGKQIAKIFLKEGCKIAIFSRNEANVEKTLKELELYGSQNIIGSACDVKDPSSINSFVKKTINAFGSVRVLVANAGINHTYGPFEYIPFEQVDANAKDVIGTNLIGTIDSIAAVLPYMKEQGYGRIITLAGAGAEKPQENMTIYSASKAGVLAFSRCLAREFKQNKQDIKINIFFPGMIDTNLNRRTSLLESWKKKEDFDLEMELLKKNVMNNIEKSCRAVLPFAIPSCRKNGEIIKGYSTMKLVRGFMRFSKELKIAQKTKFDKS
ncbi:MAG: SDR family oxidoreductase [Candidatus Lokiarchaeota archaeon]|nr:SDR family oxidoreductase [Candidatus Lokiarchaeota archaeon]